MRRNKMYKFLPTVVLSLVIVSNAAFAGPYTGQDVADGLSILGDIANGLAGAARAEQEALARQANDCAAHEMTDIFSGVKSHDGAENLKRLIDNRSVAKRIILKCVSSSLDSEVWNLES